MTPRPDRSTIDERINEAEASAPATISEILGILPDVVAEAVRLDVAAGELDGVRSPEHDRAVGLCFVVRDRIDEEPLTKAQRDAARFAVVRAMMALGYHGGLLLAWLRQRDTGEPGTVDPRDEVIEIPIIRHIRDQERWKNPHRRVRPGAAIDTE